MATATSVASPAMPSPSSTFSTSTPGLRTKRTKLYGVAMFVLGNMQLLFKRNETRALSYYIRSAAAGFAQSHGVLGFFFEFALAGLGCNYIMAERLYTAGAKKGSGLAQARLAFLKTHGRPGIRIHQAEAEKWRRMCSARGESAIGWLRAAAEAGNPSAQFCVSLCYYNGIAVGEDDAEAFRWCEKAASQNHAGAQNVLGNLYIEGTGCPVNPAQGLKWYIRAAEQREAAAIYNIGTLFERGLAVREDYVQAFDWYVRAALFGSINAQNVLGIFFEQGIGVPQDPQNAVAYYTKAALNGHPHAQYNLGRCYHDGFGCQHNNALAVAWFEMAALQNHSLSQLSLGVCNEYGIGTAKNFSRALEFYGKAAASDCVEARRRLSVVVACQILVPARVLLNCQTRDGGDNNSVPSSRSVGISSLPVELMESILSFLDPHHTLTKTQLRSIFTIASNTRQPQSSPTPNPTIPSGFQTKTQFLIFLILPVFKLSCCVDCKQIKHVISMLEDPPLSPPVHPSVEPAVPMMIAPAAEPDATVTELGPVSAMISAGPTGSTLSTGSVAAELLSLSLQDSDGEGGLEEEDDRLTLVSTPTPTTASAIEVGMEGAL